ncbi:hypothetical protein [Streptomyces sp. NPDC001480]|uniref:hypothetical protein n=1 Tax=Streptomyces sp. NPDC001480 TaxID=3364577 RepID=UPI0036C7660C
MRPFPVPVRLAATAMVLAAASGCVNVGDDAGPARASHSAGRRDGDAPDGLTVVSGRGGGYGGEVADGKHGHGGKRKQGKKSASASAAPSAKGSAPASAPSGPGRTEKPGDPAPTQAQPTPSRTAEPTPTPPPPPPPPPPASSEPPTAEPSSSAHEETGPQLAQREPAPVAGSPV